jgi:hypothetical protein
MDHLCSYAHLMSYVGSNRYVFMLLDVFNNIIQYQYAGNASLVYSIARRAKLFQQLTIGADHTSIYYPIKPLHLVCMDITHAIMLSMKLLFSMIYHFHLLNQCSY